MYSKQPSVTQFLIKFLLQIDGRKGIRSEENRRESPERVQA